MIQVGDFIEIPAWRTEGMVIAIESAHYGSDEARRVLLQEHPDQPDSACRWYHLEPGQYDVN